MMPPLRLELSSRNPRLCTVEFLTDGGIKFIIAYDFRSVAMFGNLRSRLIAARALFLRARQCNPYLTGKCDVWLGDIPECSCLAFCGNNPSHVLIPDPDFLSSRGYEQLREPAFQDALHEWNIRSAKVFWRGSITGNSDKHLATNWRAIPRIAMCIRLRENELFDVALTGEPHQIHDASQAREVLESGLIQSRVGYADFARHRALIDIDGNSSAWSGLMTKLLIRSTVIKVDSLFGYRQWYYDRLIPWKNFIPATDDFENLPAIAEWIRAHPIRAREIADEGFSLASSITFESAVDEAAQRIIDYTRIVST